MISGTRLRLLPQRALLLPDEATLLIADAHIGKAVSFRRLGVPVPQANRSTLSSRRATSRQRTGRGVAHAAPALIARSAAAMRSRMWANVGASPMNMGLILAKSVRSS